MLFKNGYFSAVGVVILGVLQLAASSAAHASRAPGASSASSAIHGTSSQAHRDASRALQIGVLTGVNVSSYSMTPSNDHVSSRAGFVGGVYADYPVVSYFSVRPGLYFSQKGFKLDDRLTGAARTEERLTVSQLELPIHAVGKFAVTDWIVPSFFAGPNFMYKVSASQSRVDADGREDAQVAALDPKVSTFGLGLDFGTGLDIRLTRDVSLLGQFRFTLGLTDESDVAALSGRYRGAQFLTGMSLAL